MVEVRPAESRVLQTQGIRLRGPPTISLRSLVAFQRCTVQILTQGHKKSRESNTATAAPTCVRKYRATGTRIPVVPAPLILNCSDHLDFQVRNNQKQ